MNLINIFEVFHKLGVKFDDCSGGFYIKNYKKVYKKNDRFVILGVKNITFLDANRFIKSFEKTEKKYNILFFK
ncbi:hypothetical protein DID75_00830 [Candidatus Marinamargulisbacteria bacterium SCGC AG-410-N11]|nr:hypothetical protein DID75_00830 [Candidatus Marinamargulisbacteria bacterium SCGC AG-410-N11]